jgi:hypothetical protein
MTAALLYQLPIALTARWMANALVGIRCNPEGERVNSEAQ